MFNFKKLISNELTSYNYNSKNKKFYKKLDGKEGYVIISCQKSMYKNNSVTKYLSRAAIRRAKIDGDAPTRITDIIPITGG